MRWSALLLAVALLAGCGHQDKFNDKRGRGDAPVGDVLEERRDIIMFPDQYANVAVACDGTSRMYITTRKGDTAATLVVVPNSPECAGGN